MREWHGRNSLFARSPVGELDWTWLLSKPRVDVPRPICTADRGKRAALANAPSEGLLLVHMHDDVVERGRLYVAQSSIRSKFAAGLLASVLLHEVCCTCEVLGQGTDVILRWLDHIRPLRSRAGIYVSARKYTGDRARLLFELDVEGADLVGISKGCNQWLPDSIHGQKHRLPEHKPAYSKDAKPRKKRGDAGLKRGSRRQNVADTTSDAWTMT